MELSNRPANVNFIDMTDYFCDETSCPPVIGNVIVYMDDSHITSTYSRTLVPMLSRKLAGALPSGWIADNIPADTTLTLPAARTAPSPN